MFFEENINPFLIAQTYVAFISIFRYKHSDDIV